MRASSLACFSEGVGVGVPGTCAQTPMLSASTKRANPDHRIGKLLQERYCATGYITIFSGKTPWSVATPSCAERPLVNVASARLLGLARLAAAERLPPVEGISAG